MGLTSVDALQQFVRVTFVAEVYQVLVVSVNSDIGVGPPSSLNFFGSHLVFGLELNFLFPLQVTSPSPLDLNGCDVIHCESMVFKESSREGHLVSGLDQSSTEVFHTLVLVFVHLVKAALQEFLPEKLGGTIVTVVLTHLLPCQVQTHLPTEPRNVLPRLHLDSILSELIFILKLKLLLKAINLRQLLHHLLVLVLLLRTGKLKVAGVSLRH